MKHHLSIALQGDGEDRRRSRQEGATPAAAHLSFDPIRRRRPHLVVAGRADLSSPFACANGEVSAPVNPPLTLPDHPIFTL
jgi:hypothetical protein